MYEEAHILVERYSEPPSRALGIPVWDLDCLAALSAQSLLARIYVYICRSYVATERELLDLYNLKSWRRIFYFIFPSFFFFPCVISFYCLSRSGQRTCSCVVYIYMWPVRKFSSLDGMHPGTRAALIGPLKGPWKSGFSCFPVILYLLTATFYFFSLSSSRHYFFSCSAEIRRVLRFEPYVAETNLLSTPSTVNVVIIIMVII